MIIVYLLLLEAIYGLVTVVWTQRKNRGLAKTSPLFPIWSAVWPLALALQKRESWISGAEFGTSLWWGEMSLIGATLTACAFALSVLMPSLVLTRLRNNSPVDRPE
ncbi:MAG TPA: hypothetical protein PKA27_16660 [Fimbriimonadaceae bacterium]|nr:hypothetical protein [Fimbriimonadaceae bacterium]